MQSLHGTRPLDLNWKKKTPLVVLNRLDLFSVSVVELIYNLTMIFIKCNWLEFSILASQHFTAQIIRPDGQLWFYDGMINWKYCRSINLNSHASDISICRGKKACAAFYIRTQLPCICHTTQRPVPQVPVYIFHLWLAWLVRSDDILQVFVVRFNLSPWTLIRIQTYTV